MCNKHFMLSGKNILIISELLSIFFLIISYIVNNNNLILLSFVISLLFIILSKIEYSTYYLAFMVPFSEIMILNGRYVFSLIIIVYVIKFILFNKLRRKTILYCLVILSYSILFSNFNSEIKYGVFIPIIFILFIPILGEALKQFNGEIFLKYYIYGFIISSIIGFFVSDIPTLNYLFYQTTVSNHDIVVTRYHGLCYDPNFYALSNYTILAYLLMCQKMTFKNVFLTIFLAICGLLTVSKSYFIVLLFLVVMSVIKSVPKPSKLMKLFLILLCGGVLIVFVSNKIGYDLIDLVKSRFSESDNISDLTTGRFDLWINYLKIIFNTNLWNTVFGFGFNYFLPNAVHNTLLQFLFNFGIIGCIIWALFFRYCAKIFQENVRGFEYRSSVVSLTFILGIMFLSAYTYYEFWIGIVISLLTIGRRKYE